MSSPGLQCYLCGQSRRPCNNCGHQSRAPSEFSSDNAYNMASEAYSSGPPASEQSRWSSARRPPYPVSDSDEKTPYPSTDPEQLNDILTAPGSPEYRPRSPSWYPGRQVCLPTCNLSRLTATNLNLGFTESRPDYHQIPYFARPAGSIAILHRATSLFATLRVAGAPIPQAT